MLRIIGDLAEVLSYLIIAGVLIFVIDALFLSERVLNLAKKNRIIYNIIHRVYSTRLSVKDPLFLIFLFCFVTMIVKHPHYFGIDENLP